jgi:hypothetical protein
MKMENVRINNQEIELVKANGNTEGKGWFLWNHHEQRRVGTYRTKKAAVEALEAL